MISFMFSIACCCVYFLNAISYWFSASFCSSTRLLMKKPRMPKAIRMNEFEICKNRYVLLSQSVTSVIWSLATSMITYSSTIMKTRIDTLHNVLKIYSHLFLFLSSLLDILMKKFIIRKKTSVRQPSSNVCRKILATSVANA